jgi:glycosyltransferase involved in cell wall biosynthesis
MNIWLFKVGETYPLGSKGRKMRTSHFAEALIRNGNQVTWWTSAFDHLKKKTIHHQTTAVQAKNNLRLMFVRALPYTSNFSFRRYFSLFLLSKTTSKLLEKETKPDLIVISYPDHLLAYEAARFAVKNKIPYIVDVRDPWPDSFVQLSSPYLKPLVKLALYFDFKKSRYVFEHAQKLFSMMDYLLDWALEKIPREKSKEDAVFYLGAPKVVTAKDQKLKVKEWLAALGGNPLVSAYIGSMGDSYYPKDLIKVAKILDTSRFAFLIAGDGTHLNELKFLAAGQKNILFLDWVDEEQIAEVLNATQIGVNCINENLQALPNKFFTYLSGGLAIVSSVPGESQKIIDRNKLGYNYPLNDVSELKRILTSLEENRELVEGLQRNSLRFFESGLDSETIANKFAENVISPKINEASPF